MRIFRLSSTDFIRARPFHADVSDRYEEEQNQDLLDRSLLPSNRRIVNTASLHGNTLMQMKQNIQDSTRLSPIPLGTHFSSKPVLQEDSGASACTSFDITDFEPGTLSDLPEPITMAGIGGGVQITKAGIIRYKTLDDQGAPVTIRCPGYFLPSVKQRLFSPQIFFDFHGKGGELLIRSQEAKLLLKSGQVVTMPL